MKYIQEAFDENWIAPLGPNVNGLEHDLEEFLNEDIYVAALSSGTAAIHLSLVLLDVKPGDLVKVRIDEADESDLWASLVK